MGIIPILLTMFHSMFSGQSTFHKHLQNPRFSHDFCWWTFQIFKARSVAPQPLFWKILVQSTLVQSKGAGVPCRSTQILAEQKGKKWPKTTPTYYAKTFSTKNGWKNIFSKSWGTRFLEGFLPVTTFYLLESSTKFVFKKSKNFGLPSNFVRPAKDWLIPTSGYLDLQTSAVESNNKKTWTFDKLHL